MQRTIELKTAIPGPKSQEIFERSARFEAKSAKRQFPIVWKKANGTTIEDVDGNRFLDFTSSVLTANIGHSHPRLLSAMKEQLDDCIHSYNFMNPWRAKLVEKLVEISPPSLDRAFIATTGAEVVDLAIGAAKRFTGKSEVLSFFGDYHGKTFATVSVGGKSSSREGLGPSMPGVIHAPFPYCYRCDWDKSYPSCETSCFKSIDRTLECVGSNDLACVIMEPFQGNSGQIEPPKEWVQKLAKWCQAKNVPLIFDEVQASFGRTGKLFAFEHFGIVPNLVVVGKGISGGVPLTALLGESRILDSLSEGLLSSTHGGNPLAARAACETIDIIRDEKLVENAAAMGAFLIEKLKELAKRFPVIGDVRGHGLMIGVEIVEDPKTKRPGKALALEIVKSTLKRGLMMIKPIGFHGNVIRIAPPLLITKEEIQTGLKVIEDALHEAMQKKGGSL